MFPRISSLASPSPSPLNYATPPRSTPHHLSQSTPENISRANHASKALNFSSPLPFHLSKTIGESESPFRTPHSSERQSVDKPIIQWSSLTNPEMNGTQAFTTTSTSSILATPESITSDALNSSSSSDVEGLGSRHQQIINDSGKRGRPRADVITHLILEGSSSPSGIKCRICNRVFPREKSLQAHIRTHTGEKPYTCDYPGCTKSFRQSGQLKTHQRLHAGEKPFVCSAPGCGNRYTHANRTCPAHPYHKPQRTSDLILQPSSTANSAENTTGNDEVSKWLENYRRERQDKTPTPGKNPPSEAATENYNYPVENLHTPPSSIKRSKTKRGLTSDFLEQENSPLKKPLYEHQQLPTTITTSSVYNSNFLVQSQPISYALSSAPKSPLRLSSAPKSPLRVPGSPLALISNNNKRSLLEERLNLRKTLGDITSSNNCPINAPSTSSKGSIGVLLAAAAKESTLPPNNATNLIISENDGFQRNENSSDSNDSVGRAGIIQCLPRSPKPRSPLKTLKPKKRWLKTVFQENPPREEVPDENLAMPIKWNEGEPETITTSHYPQSPKRNNAQYSLFRNSGSNVLRRSPLSMSIASTLVALHSSSPDKDDRENNENDNMASNQPLNLSIK